MWPPSIFGETIAACVTCPATFSRPATADTHRRLDHSIVWTSGRADSRKIAAMWFEALNR